MEIQILNGSKKKFFDFLLNSGYIEIKNSELIVTDKGVKWVEEESKKIKRVVSK